MISAKQAQQSKSKHSPAVREKTQLDPEDPKGPEPQPLTRQYNTSVTEFHKNSSNPSVNCHFYMYGSALQTL